MTNAHVVAGVTGHQTVTTPSGQTLAATVVYYDPQVDMAVLYVPGLNLTPLRFDDQANPGATPWSRATRWTRRPCTPCRPGSAASQNARARTSTRPPR